MLILFKVFLSRALGITILLLLRRTLVRTISILSLKMDLQDNFHLFHLNIDLAPL